jgi:hypothetical protein
LSLEYADNAWNLSQFGHIIFRAPEWLTGGPDGAKNETMHLFLGNGGNQSVRGLPEICVSLRPFITRQLPFVRVTCRAGRHPLIDPKRETIRQVL